MNIFVNVFAAFLFLRFCQPVKTLAPTSEPALTHVKDKWCPKNLTIPAWLLNKSEEINCFLQIVPRSCVPASDTGVTAITAEPNLPGLPYNSDLSLLMKHSNTPSLDILPSSLHISAFCHTPLRVNEHRVILWRWKATTSTFFWHLIQQLYPHTPPPSTTHSTPQPPPAITCVLAASCSVFCRTLVKLGGIKHFNFTGIL